MQNTPIPLPILYLLLLWTLLWRGLALWHAASLRQRNWFVVILVLNSATLGILEICYLFYFSKKRMKFNDLLFWQK